MLEFVKSTIKEAGYLAKGYYLKGVKSGVKSNPSDVITEADTEVEKFLIEKILEKYPDHGIISEERKEEINPGAEHTWVIDPIDGTRNFANHVAMWCVMVGLTKNGTPYLSAIYDAMNDELFWAQKGEGAYLNGERIKVGNYDKVEHCFLIFSQGAVGCGNGQKRFKDYVRFWNNINGDTGCWLHNMGTILTMCHLAAGRIDAVVTNAGFYHDFLAPYVIATEAGAKWTNSFGEEWKRGECDIIVANPVLHKKLLELFK
ncbi:inositol monophosphatase [Patescibacteria group bacterium]|nr:MAG: inositol monophosphatase [Patescibacteria group bacterium]